MKYITEIDIDKPIDRVIELFDNPKYYKNWMDGLLGFELKSGTQGQPGATSIFKFKMGSGEMEMLETVIIRNFPDEFTVTYQAKGVYNIVKSKFVKLDENRTKYINENEFQFSGLMKIIGVLMPGIFKKQSLKYLVDFKSFVESKV
jgi:carbon monoxide dehydrogenase subunit G